MNIVCIGGGPAGLYFCLLMKKQNPAHDVVVVERNRPDDTFGWGIVFSDQTFGHLVEADAQTARAILQSFTHWDNIDIHFKGRTIASGGHGFCGISRKRLLGILRARCMELGVKLVFETDVGDDQAVADAYAADLVVASDGVNSRIRTRYAATFQPEVDTRLCRFVWLGTKKRFDAFTFAFEETAYGWLQAHIYPFDENTSTVIVEIPEDTWVKAGLDAMHQEQGIAWCEKLFAPYLDGHALLSNAGHLHGSAMWTQFLRVRCGAWIHWRRTSSKNLPVVLMGDAAHSAHFSIGSGTKLALEDAIELAHCLRACPTLEPALATYQERRSSAALKLQHAARNSMEWFENVRRYAAMEAEQFAYSLLTRSQRISHENLRLRDPGYVARHEHWVAQRAYGQAGLPVPQTQRSIPPMLTPFKLRGCILQNRIVVSPMAQYSCIDGIPGDFHLVHLGSRAMGGAGMVMTEMTGISADARITPACPGLYRPEHTAAWRRIVDFVHANSDAKVAVQIGHAGPKGSTRRAWEGIDLPLAEGNWPLMAASEQQYLAGISQVARTASTHDLDCIQADFVRAAQAAAQAGFDWLELHCAHGYLLSSFISPLTNQRTDEYGGTLANRCRYPLRVLQAIRAVWPEDKPISVRISAHDWVEGGITPDDAIEIARLFKAAGADMIDCSSGQVSPRQKPVYGRMYQTPFADRIRHEAGIPTIAVGAIYEADHANGIIASGRADLCALARPHLANPAWTLHEAAKLGFDEIAWPRQYAAGKHQLERQFAPVERTR